MRNPRFSVVIFFLLFGSLAHGAVNHARISEQSAEKVAKKAQPGVVEAKKLSNEHGKWIYSFSIRGDDQKLHQVRVDARSGKVIPHK